MPSESFPDDDERVDGLSDLGNGFYQVHAAYGFMQTDTSFFLGRETLLITHKPGMSRWHKALFSFSNERANGVGR